MIDWTNFNSSLLIEVTRPNGIFTSSAVAIDRHTLLTAAHCLEGEILHVRISQQSCYNPKGIFFDVETFELHPEYDAKVSNFKNDIARIRLSQPLPKETTIFSMIKASKPLTGRFLRLGYGHRNNLNARTLITPLFKNHDSLQGILELHDEYSFSGDSGGPIFLQDRGQMYLVAIHSTLSFGSEGKYSFNPLISNHREWILSPFNADSLTLELTEAV